MLTKSETPNEELQPATASQWPQRMGRYRWVVCALLFFATTINYIDRQTLSLVKEQLDRELGWSNEQFGLVNSAFQLAYAVGLLGFGWFIDRFGTKIGYAVSITAWSIAAMGHGIVGSVRGFVTARLCLGLGEGGNFPAAIKVIALWFPKKERAMATALFNSGCNVGSIVAPAVVPILASAYGWRAAFAVAGVAGLVWLLFWLPFYNVPEKIKNLEPSELLHIRSDKDEPVGGQPDIPWRQLLRYRQTWSFVVAKFMTDPVWWFFLIWLPDYFKKTRGLDIKHSWKHIGTIYAIVTVLSICGGWLTGALIKRGWSNTRARKTGLLLFAFCAVPILTVTQAGDWMAVMLIGLAGAAHQAWSATLYTTVSDVFPKRAIASVIGLGSMAGSIGGAIFPIVTGKLLDHFESLGHPVGGYRILFGICGSAYLVAFVFNQLLAPSFAPIGSTEKAASLCFWKHDRPTDHN